MNVLIVGLGVSGISAAKFLKNLNCKVSIFDDNKATLENFSSEYEIYDKNKKYSLAIISPGVSPSHPVVLDLARQGTEIIGEIELASRYLTTEKVIAVTGTNGKSTSVSLIHAFLSDAGYNSFLCGNIGMPVVEGVGKNYDFLVIEVSSFQLETLKNLKLDVAVILNITPDHLDRYKNFEEYRKVKLNLLNLLKDGGVAVLNRALSFETKKSCLVKYFSFDGSDDISFDKGFLLYKNNKIKIDDLKIQGHCNIENIMAAILSVEKWVNDPNLLRKSLLNFRPLAHRMAFVDEYNGVKFVDDSKGTNVGAVENSLSGFNDGSVVLILGGVDKGGSYEPIRKLADKKCKGIVLIGTAKESIKPFFKGFSNVVEAESMCEAVEKSYFLAANSGVVLLSPACSSFDWYKNYKERGLDFVNKVNELKNKLLLGKE